MLSLFYYEKRNFYFDTGIRFFTGIIAVVFFTSVFVTKGKTIFIFLLILAFYLLRQSPRQGFNRFFDKKLQYKSHLFLSCFATLFFVLFFCRILSLNPSEADLLTYDTHYFAQSSKLIFQYGIETVNINSLDFPSKLKIVPYHYFDMWLNAIMAYLFSLNHSFSMVLITYSLLSISCAMIFLGLLKEFLNKASLVFLILGCFLLILSAGKTILPHKILNLFNPGLNQFNAPMIGLYWMKLLPIYSCIAMSIMFFKKNKQNLAVVSLLLMLLFYAQVIIGLGGLVLFLLFNFASNKKNKTLLFVALFLFLFVTFYYKTFLLTDGIAQVKIEQNVSINFKQYLIIFVERLLSYFSAFWLLFVCIIFYLIKKNGSAITFLIPFVFILSVSFTFWIININTVDMWQAFFVLAVPFSNLAQGILIMTISYNFFKKWRYFIISACLLFFTYNYLQVSTFKSDSEIGSITEEFDFRKIYSKYFKENVLKHTKKKKIENILIVSDYDSYSNSYFGNMPLRFLYFSDNFIKLYWIDLEMDENLNIYAEPDFSNKSIQNIILQENPYNYKKIINNIVKEKKIDAVANSLSNRSTNKAANTKIKLLKSNNIIVYDTLFSSFINLTLVSHDTIVRDKFYSINKE